MQGNPNPQTSSSKGGMPSIVSPDLRVQGDLMSTGDIQVEGIVDGGVFCRQVTIGKSGSVSGAMETEIAHISGRAEGQIRAKSVTLTDTARVEGDIFYETLAVDAGAQLKGRCTRQPWSAGTPTPAVQEPKKGESPGKVEEKGRPSERTGEKEEVKLPEDKAPTL